jgi:gliding motility-associated-like protein
MLIHIAVSFSQNISISGIPNHYLQVDSILADRVRVVETAELSYFQPGDKVLIIQITGGEVFDGANFKTANNKYQKTYNQVGKFEILQLDEVWESGGRKYVVFTDNLENAYDQGEKIQLVRFVEGDNVIVTGTVNAKEWDGTTGGIVAIIGMDSVKLNANIDVNYRGFRGGSVPAENYTGGCRQDISAAVLDTLYFLPTELNRSGNKGEGIVTVSWPYTKGTAFALNGGGAGNGLYSGGGGGSNYSKGGDGGKQSTACDAFTLRLSWGGFGCYWLYSAANRQIIMGGGGGSGVKSATATASRGGDGGGIVILLTGTLVGNNRSVYANGETAAAATGSGGGGGGGGTVLIDASGYSGTFNVYAKGGNGGRTDGNCTGSGGGGSGGVLWHSGNSVTTSTLDLAAGSEGYATPGCAIHSGGGGDPGAKLTDLLMPLTGFLFNTIHGKDTICAGQAPGLLTGSQPKGGDGTYDFQWEQSADQLSWSEAQGVPTLKTFQPAALTQTTYYRRIVSSLGVYDTSRIIEVYVYPAISNNLITGTDTICSGSHGKPITGTLPAGGNNNYLYQWQVSPDLTTWNNSGAQLSSNDPLDPGVPVATRYYRRLVNSTAYCRDTSNFVTLTVLPSIVNNGFVSADTVICENLGPGLLNAKTPAGGDGNYTYLWQEKYGALNWQDIPGTNMIRYDPGLLTQTTLFRRIVFSGEGNACIDTSVPVKTVNVLPAIANNIIVTDSGRYCAGDIPEPITGLLPAGGAGTGTYTYQWQMQTDGDWQIISGASGVSYTPQQTVTENTRFNRIVTSGTYNACRDTSPALELFVVDYIDNNLGIDDQTICQSNTPVSFSPPPATGGFGPFTYQWIRQEEGDTNWENATGNADQITYAPPQLEITTLFARKAFSDICTRISDTIAVTVYPAISGNSILGDDIKYACFGTSLGLSGSFPQQGKAGDYTYLWEQSQDKTAWIPATDNTNNSQDFQTGMLTAPQYFRRIAFSSSLNHECVDTSEVAEIRIKPLPDGDVISAEDTICAGGSIYVKFDVSGANGPFDVTIGNGSISLTKYDVPSGIDSIALSLNTGELLTMLAVIDDSTCAADLSGKTGVETAVVFQVPVANAGPDDEICGNQYTLHAIRSIQDSEGLWSAQDVVFGDSTDNLSNAITGNYGTKVFTWAERNWHCTDADEVEVTFYEQPETIDAGPDQVLDFSFTTHLEAWPPAVGKGQWTIVAGSGNFDNDTLPDATISELSFENQLKWTVTNGTCEPLTDIVLISVNPLLIRKGFTPNGDGKNDEFDLGATNAEWIKIKIFNSTGMLVFESDDYQEGSLWDGHNMNGVEVPEGTYFYLAEMKIAGKAETVHFRSFVEILR